MASFTAQKSKLTFSILGLLAALALPVSTTAQTHTQAPASPPNAADALCGNNTTTGALTGGGRCVKNYNGICAGVTGPVVWLSNQETVTLVDSRVSAMIATARKQGFLSDACLNKTDVISCLAHWPRCQDGPNGEGLPILECQADCVDYWTVCDAKNLFALYLQTLSSPAESKIPFCGYSKDPLPPDHWGGRRIEGYPTYPVGLAGVPMFPAAGQPYLYTVWSTQQNVSLQCQPFDSANHADHPPVPLQQAVQCVSPLVPTADGSSCALPCPYPIFDRPTLTGIGVAFSLPGNLGFALCVLVFLDALWVMVDSTSFTFVRVLGTSATSSGRQQTQSSGTGASHQARRRQLRAAVSYAFVGSALGIIYWIVGPLGAMAKAADGAMCPAGAKFVDVNRVLNAREDYSDTACRAMRVAPFVLQAVFNLVLWCTFRIVLVVSDRARRMDRGPRIALNMAVLAYCVLTPLVCLATALGLDAPATDILSLHVELARNAGVCYPRLPNLGVEFAVVFLPYLVTGVLVVAAACFVMWQLHGVRSTTKGMVHGRSKSSTALESLMARLTMLGLATFSVLVTFFIVTMVQMSQLSTYAPLFQAWFACGAACTCSVCNCDAEKAAFIGTVPTAALFGLQQACMSIIVVVVGAFFAAQCAARLGKEAGDGTLRARVIRVLGKGGKPLDKGCTTSKQDANPGTRDKKRTGEPLGDGAAPSCAFNTTEVVAFKVRTASVDGGEHRKDSSAAGPGLETV